MTLRWLLLGGLWLALGAQAARAAENTVAEPSAEQIEFFEKHVRPVLANHCIECHGPDVQEAGLRLDRREHMLRGIDGHPVVVAGEPTKSRLVSVMRYDGDVQMPPDGKLPDAEFEAMVTWVKMGLPWPAPRDESAVAAPGLPEGSAVERIAAVRATHWALQPIAKPPLPATAHAAWSTSPLDRLIAARLEASGVAPSPPADRPTLIRRAYFDLIGLPPTAEEVAAFVADNSPDAFAHVVDRLLASPGYGERWGRHWLDLARYSDTKGYAFQQERRFPFAYTYRDWVIDAFNRDMPFDRFVIEQLAADLLPDRGDDARPLAALGFLTVGRRFSRIHDTLDDRIDVVTRGLLGLTVSCARCHDHKYDPIPIDDYYSLYSIFANTEEPENPPLLGAADDSPEYHAFVAEREKLQSDMRQYIEEQCRAMADEVRGRIDLYLELATRVRLGKPMGVATDADGKPLELRTQMVNRWHAALRRKPSPAEAVFGPYRELTALAAETFAETVGPAWHKLQAAGEQQPASAPNRLLAAALDEAELKSPADVGAVYSRVFAQVQAQWQARVAQAEKNQQPPPEQLDDPAAEQIRQLLYGNDNLVRVEPADFERFMTRRERAKLRELQRKVEQLDVTSPGAPPRPMMLVDVQLPNDKPVLIRGNPARPGPKAPRRFLQMLSDGSPEPYTTGSGRLQLAQAIVDPANPLTARVIANRVWMHHVGVGLVVTPSDFGTRSDPPSHPELLDWLAATLIEQRWSLKALHRQIMLSATYQQTSQSNPAAAAIDPENRLLWRMNRRRLELEPMRDALLAVAGRLDTRLGGRPAQGAWLAPFSSRRTVYAYIDRQDLPGVFNVFDFASPDTSIDQRPRTTVPQQALFAMNSPFMLEMARSLARRPELTAAATPAEKIRALYHAVYSRDPAADELRLGEQFVEAAGAASPPPPLWQYGHGAWNDEARQLTRFTPLPHFNGERWQAGPEVPDPQLGYIMLSAGGGHPGNVTDVASVLRFTAPAAMTVEIVGRLEHPRAEGDGVRATIVADQQQVVGQWIAHNTQVDTAVERLTLEAGATIDLVVDCRDGPVHDSYRWSPSIRVLDGPREQTFSASRDFRGPLPPALSNWELYAQVLLLANEFLFID